ncbi:mCG1027651, isoform CRA_a, partial [Mus musculus]
RRATLSHPASKMRYKARGPEPKKPSVPAEGEFLGIRSTTSKGPLISLPPRAPGPSTCSRARRKGSCGNLQAGLNPSPTGATPRLEITSPLWMLELRLSFLTWGLEYAQSRISELEEASCSGKDVCGPSPPA